MEKTEIGVIGLAVMGANLARNIARHHKTIVFNRTTEKTDKFIKEFGNENLLGSKTLEEFVENIEAPRKIIVMVKAGDPVDAVIEQLTPLLEKGDIIIDGGNSHYKDTQKREKDLSEKGIHFIGMGISGGEEGALNGPSMMPGGSSEAYEKIAPILQASAADDGLGGKCVTHLGLGASGHFVKMVHNGIEYGIMQLIAESYDILKKIGKYSNEELAQTFSEWSKTKNLKSFLIEITAKIFAKKEEGKDIIDLIKDQAKQKGTGKWTSVAALDYGVCTTTITSAVDARIISGQTTSRQTGKHFPTSLTETEAPSKETLKEMVKNALILSTISTYYQGMDLLLAASNEYKWNLNLSEIARIWLGGCIIRSDFLLLLQKGMQMTPEKESEAKMAKMEILNNFNGKPQKDWRKLLSLAIAHGVPTPATSSTLAYFDALRQDHLPQNLIQAQRDFFGAHTYSRTDKEGTFHTDWE